MKSGGAFGEVGVSGGSGWLMSGVEGRKKRLRMSRGLCWMPSRRLSVLGVACIYCRAIVGIWGIGRAYSCLYTTHHCATACSFVSLI